MVTTVTSQQPYHWSDDVIKKAPTVQTGSRGPVQGLELAEVPG